MEMLTLDPAATLSTLDSKLNTISDPKQHRLLALLRDRLVGELLGDPERVFAAMAPDFVLTTRAAGSPDELADNTKFRAMFEQVAALGVMIWGEWDHIVVDDESVVLEGLLSTLLPAALVGLQAEDPTTLALSQTRSVIIVTFADELMVRELLISDPTTKVVTPVPASAAPDRAKLANLLGR